MNHSHYIEQCSCGEIVNQCRCFSLDKTIKIIKGSCNKCKAKMTTTPQPPTEARELKACPFTHSMQETKALFYDQIGMFGVGLPTSQEWYVKCSCGAISPKKQSKEEAITAWNTRTTPTAREVLEEFKHKVLDEVWEFWGDSRTARKMEQIIAKQIERMG